MSPKDAASLLNEAANTNNSTPNMGKAWELISQASQMLYAGILHDTRLQMLTIFQEKTFSAERVSKIFDELCNCLSENPIYWHHTSEDYGRGESLFHYACRQGIYPAIVVASSAYPLGNLDSNYLYSCYANLSAFDSRQFQPDSDYGELKLALFNACRLSRLMERAEEKGVPPQTLTGFQPT